MWPTPPETADLVTFTEEFLMGNFIFCAVMIIDNKEKQDLEKKIYDLLFSIITSVATPQRRI